MRAQFENFGARDSGDAEAPPVAPLKSELLQRIADTIGVTVDMLRGDTPSRAERSPATTAEIHALLDAFLALRQPEARRRCIALASAERGSGN